MPDPLPQPEPPVTLVERLAVLEARISALEADVARVEEEQPDRGEIGRLAWFIKHGRRRPW